MKRRIAWLIVVAMALAQSCCIGLWLTVIAHGISDPDAALIGLPAVLLPLQALLAMVLPTVLLRPGWSPGRRALTLYAVALAAIAVSLAPALLARLSHASGTAGNLLITAIALALLWWRGAILADEEFGYDAVFAEWCWLTAALVVAVLLGAGSGALSGVAGPLLLLFFVSSLVALAAAWRRGVAGHLPAISGSWAATLAILVPVFVVPALLGAILLGPSFAASLGRALGTLLDGLLFLLSPLLFAAGWLVALIIELLRSLLHPNSGQLRQTQIPRTPTTMTIRPIAQAHLVSALPWAVAAIVIILLVTYILIRRAAHTQAAAVLPVTALDEEREMLLSWREAWRAFVFWLGTSRRRRLAVMRHHATILDADTGLPLNTLTVRDVYRHLLALGASRGVTRASVETPHEYLSRLRRPFATREKEVSLITAAYVYTRYGPLPASPAQAEHVRLAWERVMTAVLDAAEE